MTVAISRFTFVVRSGMRWLRPACVAVAGLGLAATAQALTSAQGKEVAVLLDRVSHSGCTFMRNGSAHTSAEAAAHLRRKLDATRDRLGSVDEFIDKVASKSSSSGKPYQVHCGGQALQDAQPWLESLRRQ